MHNEELFSIYYMNLKDYSIELQINFLRSFNELYFFEKLKFKYCKKINRQSRKRAFTCRLAGYMITF